MSKHTPGPWYAVDGNKHRDFNQIAIRASGLRRKTGGDVTLCHVERFNEANATLIATAPDLLAMCEELAECSDYWSEYDVPIGIAERLRDVIAKAKGES